MEYLSSEQGENFKINLYDHGCAVAIADYDADGHDDVFFTNELGANALFRGDGTGAFTDVTATTGADLGMRDKICVGATFGDYDNDGFPDLFVATTRAGNVLFHNEGNGKFTDVTKKAGVTLVGHSETGTFFDPDMDGDLDLLVTNTAKWTTDDYHDEEHHYTGPPALWDLLSAVHEPNVYYRNDGGGKFTVATEESGLAAQGWNGDCAVFDYDADGAPDLFMANMFGGSQLFKNDGKGHFIDVTRPALRKISYGAMGSRAFDYDLDGKLDLMVVDMHSDMWMTAEVEAKDIDEHRKYSRFFGPTGQKGTVPLKLQETFTDIAHISNHADFLFGNTLFHNLGGGKFEEVSDKAGVESFWPWGVTPADYRNAGIEDVLVVSGMGHPFFYWRNNYFLNRGDGTFEESAAKAGFDPPPGGINLDLQLGGKPAPKSSRSAATGDFDGDGRVDIVVSNFNDRAYLYMNRTPQRNWIGFHLTGTKSNRDAIGALVTIRAGGKSQIRLVQAGGGYLSQSSARLHFGLNDATEIESCEILWPSGTTQSIEHPAVNTLHEVTEPGA